MGNEYTFIGWITEGRFIRATLRVDSMTVSTGPITGLSYRDGKLIRITDNHGVRYEVGN